MFSVSRFILVFAIGIKFALGSANLFAQSEAKIDGAWYDAFDNLWTVGVEDKLGRQLYTITKGKPKDDEKPLQHGLIKRVAGLMGNGKFTVDFQSFIQRGSETPVTRYEVDTRVPGVLIVEHSLVYRYSRPNIRNTVRFELTRKTGILNSKKYSKLRSLDELEKAIKSKNWIVRRGAIRELGEYHQAPQGLGLLMRALKDDFHTNQLIAVKGIARSRKPIAIRTLLSCACSRDAQLKKLASQALVNMGPEVSDTLLTFLERKVSLNPFSGNKKFSEKIEFHSRCDVIAGVVAKWKTRGFKVIRKKVLSYWDQHDPEKAMSENLVSVIFLKVLPRLDSNLASKLVLEFFDKYSRQIEQKHRFPRYDVYQGIRLLGLNKSKQAIPILLKFSRSAMHQQYSRTARRSLQKYDLQAIPEFLKVWQNLGVPNCPLPVRMTLFSIVKSELNPVISNILARSNPKDVATFSEKLNTHQKNQLKLILSPVAFKKYFPKN